jgi:hypothetical protein
MGGQGPRVRQIPGFAVDFASILGACAEKLISLTPSTPCAPSPLRLQKIRLPRRAKHRQISAHPVHQEGRIMIATNAGQDAVAAGLFARRARNGGRSSRVVLSPRCWGQACQSNLQATGAIKPGTPGRARSSRKAIAQGVPDRFGLA